MIRDADPARDAAACAAIYAPYVETSAISFEERPPDAARDGGPDRALPRTHPWLVAEEGGEVVGYAYACRHRERAAYRWAADVSVYVAGRDRRGRAWRGLYEELFERLRRQRFQVACAGITLPNTASVGLHERARLRSASASTAASAGSGTPGTTSAGGSWSWRRPVTIAARAAAPGPACNLSRTATSRRLGRAVDRAPRGFSDTLTEQVLSNIEYAVVHRVGDPDSAGGFATMAGTSRRRRRRTFVDRRLHRQRRVLARDQRRVASDCRLQGGGSASLPKSERGGA